MKFVYAVVLMTLAWDAKGTESTLGESIEKATLRVLEEVYRGSDDKNVITSPLGVFILLSLYSTGASPGIKEEIDRFLGAGEQDNKQLSESYSKLSNDFAQMDPSYFTLANKIYVSDDVELVPAFGEVARTYNSEVDKIDFAHNQKAADAINAWAAEKTQGHITSPVSADDFSGDTVIALLNAIYFEGEWEVPFDKSKTKDEDFFVAKNTTVKKPTMSLLASIPYTRSEDLGASVFELDYKEDGFRTIIVLPDEIDGLPAVLEKATQKGLLKDLANLADTYINLSFPKFEIRSKFDFRDIFAKIGLTKIFEEASDGIVNLPATVYKIFQEATVKFDEKGAIATAVSGMFALFRMAPVFAEEALQIQVDHPFLFYILHHDTVLFSGTYTH